MSKKYYQDSYHSQRNESLIYLKTFLYKKNIFFVWASIFLT